MNRLEQSDAYVRVWDAVVSSVDGASVCLDRSAFYPGGGGQPADAGAIRVGDESWQVLRARIDEGEVWLDLDREAPPSATSVSAELDWDRRHKLMRTHTALHVLCGVVWRDWGAKVTGGNMEPLRGRMDFEFETMSGELVREIESRVNAEVGADRAVRVSFMAREEADANPDLIRTKVNLIPASVRTVRVVDIEGLDIQADGGTHVASTAEVGRVEVTGYKSKGRINKRIEIVVAD